MERRPSAWMIASSWAVTLVALLTLLATVCFHYQDQREARHAALLEHRREALFKALGVIDAVYSNVDWYGEPPKHPIPVDLQAARDADNSMRIYCQYPETLEAFRNALGLHNPNEGTSKKPSITALDEFRKQIAKELDLAPPVGLDPHVAWISNLEGAK